MSPFSRYLVLVLVVLPFCGVASGASYRVELSKDSPVGEASIRESAVAWHPGNQCYYLVADVIPLASPHHPNTYETSLHLWRSHDLDEWVYIGEAVPKGDVTDSYQAHGSASAAGMVYRDGRLLVPFSARKTAQFTERGIGLAWSGPDPEKVPWTIAAQPISDLPGEDDDPAVLTIPGEDRLHLYHRTTGAGGYRIVHTASTTPQDPGSWPTAVDVTTRPPGVRAQELTGAVYLGERVHLFIIEQGDGVDGIPIAHLVSERPEGPFEQASPSRRYLTSQPASLAYGGHFTPVVREGRLLAGFWTTWQTRTRYGLQGQPLPADWLETQEKITRNKNE